MQNHWTPRSAQNLKLENIEKRRNAFFFMKKRFFKTFRLSWFGFNDRGKTNLKPTDGDRATAGGRTITFSVRDFNKILCSTTSHYKSRGKEYPKDIDKILPLDSNIIGLCPTVCSKRSLGFYSGVLTVGR